LGKNGELVLYGGFMESVRFTFKPTVLLNMADMSNVCPTAYPQIAFRNVIFRVVFKDSDRCRLGVWKRSCRVLSLVICRYFDQLLRSEIENRIILL